MVDKKNIEEKKYLGVIQDYDKFMLPDMGDYMSDEMTLEFMGELEGELSGEADAEGLGKNFAFFAEAPFTLNEGYYPDKKAFVIKADISYKGDGLDYIEDNVIDGDTIPFITSSATCGSEPFEIAGKQYRTFNDYVKESIGKEKDSKEFEIRFVGMDALEVPHYSAIKSGKDYEKETHKAEDLSKLPSNYIYRKPIARNKKDEVVFIKIEDNYHEFLPYRRNLYVAKDETPSKFEESDNGKINYGDMDYYRDAIKAKKKVEEAISKMTDMRIVIDAKTISKNAKYDYNDEFLDILESTNSGSGYNLYGMDMYRRFLGAIYVKMPFPGKSEGEWINLNKYVLANTDKTVQLPDFSSNPLEESEGGFLSDVFRMWSYDLKNFNLQDTPSIGDLNDVRTLQERITGRTYEDMYDWTVVIGDNAFMVPPTSIRVVSQNENQRVSLLRAKGSASKSSPRTDRIIEMQLYFNEDVGINGYKIEETFGGGHKANYYMNGLRSLLAMFKFTPFLPITNRYLNEVLNVEAVALAGVTVSTMPDYPKCIAVNLTLQEFDYRIYMPDLPLPTGDTEEDLQKNMFAETINYKVMRYYYQRCLMRGNALRELPFDSQEYLEQTLGDKTALQPMKFDGPKIDFYTVDLDFLDAKQQAKMLADSSNTNQLNNLTDAAKKYREEYMAPLGDAINDIMLNSKMEGILKTDHLSTPASVINSMIKEHFDEIPVDSVDIKRKDKDGKYRYDVTFGLSRNGLSDIELEDLLQNLAEEAEMAPGDIDKNRFKVTYIVDAITGKVETEIDDYADVILNIGRYNASLTPGEIMQDEAQDLIAGNKRESAESMKFSKFPVDDLRIKTMASSFGNSFSQISLQLSDGYAPQYVGAQDSAVEIVIETTDEGTVRMLNQLPKLASMYMRKYRDVLTVWPIRIDSEITRLMGINEVIVDSIDIGTVPNYPGVYSITMRLTSVDRTLKNRELLNKIEQEEGLDSMTTSGSKARKAKDFFELKEGLAKAEVYPDLELPSIDELEKLGFHFIRYTARPNMRVYPDPDFYFYYGHVLGNAIFRNAITEFILNNGGGQEFEMTDLYGGQLSVKPNDDGTAYSLVSRNENVIFSEEKEEQVGGIKKALMSEKRNTKKLENLETMLDAELHEKWNICDDVKCHFREKHYEKYMDGKYTSSIQSKEEKLLAAIDRELSKNPFSGMKKSDYIAADSRTFEGLVTLECINLFNKDENFKDVAEVLKLDSKTFSRKLENRVSQMLLAVGCARTGEYECTAVRSNVVEEAYQSVKEAFFGSENLDGWQPKVAHPRIPTLPFAVVGAIGQDLSANTYATSIEDALENGVLFGPFGFREYSASEISSIDGTTPKGKDLYLLDPYFRKASKKEIEEYKILVMTSAEAATRAILREVLLWLKVLTKNGLLISVYDHQSVNFLEKHRAGEVNIVIYENTEEDMSEEQIKELKKVNDSVASIVKEDKDAIILGKIFAACALSATEGDSKIFNMMKNRDYNSLNGYVESTKNSSVKDSMYDPLTKKFRQFIKGLVGYGIIDTMESIAEVERDLKQELSAMADGKLFIQAAEQPYIYLGHSFYDMIVNDKRGRMLRAFPCYYMMLIDEGREIGFWKLHDNFYNMNAISEIQITKSRKIAADTAMIQMSNMFKTFDQDDYNLESDAKYSIWDAAESIFSPYKYALEAEHDRQMAPEPSSVMLRPGIRMHLRMGYGANASMLPVVFNGCITEVGNGEVVEIVAQGDGVELTNPITSTLDAEEEQNKDRFIVSKLAHNLMTNGERPKTILTSMLKKDEYFTEKLARYATDGMIGGKNPYGIYHFGDEEFDDIFSEGEFVQNIYEAGATPNWGKNKRSKDDFINNYAQPDAPKISFELSGKTYWDVMHICKSAATDYVTSVVPFQFRSSIFYGAPRYYYAYDYDRAEDGTIREKRKPFQQHHIYTSYSDIISNNVIASEKDIKTCAVGVFMSQDVVWGSSEDRVGPIFIDSDIYTEKQKTMIVNTNLNAKGIPIIGAIPIIGGLPSVIMNKVADEEGKIQGGESVAFRMTCDALKNSVKDMYKGDLIVLGDPSVKPYDKVHIHDLYTTINGAVEVEAVVHTFSQETGFITSVYPDCVVTVDDRFERISQGITKEALAKSLATYTALVLPSWIFSRNTKPLLTQAFKYAGKSGQVITDNINNILRLVDKNDISTSKFINALNKAAGGLGIGVSISTLDTLLNDFARLSNLKGIPDGADMLTVSKYLDDLAAKSSPSVLKDTLTELDDAITKATDATQKAQLQAARDAIQKGSDDVTKALNNKLLASFGQKDIDNVVSVLKGVASKSDNADFVKEIDDIVRGFNGKSNINSADDLKKLSNALSKMGNVSDDIADVADDLLKTAKNLHNGAVTDPKLLKLAGDLADGKEIKAASSLLGKGKGFGLVGGIPGMIAEFAIMLVIESVVKSVIERELASMQALQIYPLKKNGKVMVAGLDGHKGIVVGSPTENQEGLIGEYVGKIFGSDDGMTDSVKGFLLGLFATDKMREIGKKFRHEKAAESNMDISDPVALSNKLLNQLASEQVRKSSGYYAELMKPRMSVVSNEKGELTDEAAKYFNSHAVIETDNIEKDEKVINKMKPLMFNQLMRDMASKKMFFTMHDLSKSKKEKVFNIGGSRMVVNCVSDNGVLEVPFLAQDSLYLLETIIRELAEKYDADDKYGEDSWFKTHTITLQSALRAGKKTMAATGLCFTFTVKNCSNIEEILLKIQKDQQKVYEAHDRGEFLYFKYSQNKSKTNTFDIEVFPRKSYAS